MSATEAPPRDERAGGREPSSLVVLYALWGGLASWAMHLWTVTSLVGTACDHGIRWVMHLATVATAIGAVAAIGCSVLMSRRVSDTAAANGRTRMLAVLALLIDVVSLALIVLEGIPILVLDPCKSA